MIFISVMGKKSNETQTEICPLDLAIEGKMGRRVERNCGQRRIDCEATRV